MGVIIGNGDFVSGRKGCLSITSSNLRYAQNGSTYYTVYHQGNLGIANDENLGLIKSGGEFASVNTDGTLTISRARTADNAENDENGDNIVNTYLKKSDIINGDSKVIHYVNSTYGSYFKIGHLTRNVEKDV